MTNAELIDIASAAEAGIRVQQKPSWRSDADWYDFDGNWVIPYQQYRVHPEDREEWERIKVERSNLHCKVEHSKVMPGGWHQADLNKADTLPPVTSYTFPECAPKPQDPGYGYDLDGKKIEPPDDRHEIIPEGTEVDEGEVTHCYVYKTGWWPDSGVFDSEGLAKTVDTIYGEPGHIRAYARLKYEVLHRESGIKVGDTVRVVRKAEDFGRGWYAGWNNKMDKCVGETVTVKNDSGNQGFGCYSKRTGEIWWFPAFVLEKVAPPEMVPLEGKDWKIGNVVRLLHSKILMGITSINMTDHGVFAGGTWKTPEELQKHYERLDPVTGEWVRCEKEKGAE